MYFIVTCPWQEIPSLCNTRQHSGVIPLSCTSTMQHGVPLPRLAFCSGTCNINSYSFSASVLPVIEDMHHKRNHWVVGSVPTSKREVGVQIPAMAEISFQISVSPAPPSPISYNEYTDRTLPVGRWDGKGVDWPSTSHAEVKKIKSLANHTHWRNCSFTSPI